MVNKRPIRHRTKLCDRVLPSYTAGEEVFNMVTHIVGGAVGILTLISCLLVSVWHHSLAGILCSVVFGISMITLYTMSSIYHGLRTNTSKKVFQIIDHCTIYFLIAGTYTPILVCGLAKTHPIAAWLTFGAVWGMAALASTLNAIDLARYKVFSMICYIGMGWSILFTIHPVYVLLGTVGFSLLIGGGIWYSAGVLFYQLGKRKKYFHSVFHIFVLLGSVSHALCILFYVL